MKRVRFLPGEQREFIRKACNGKSIKKFLNDSKINVKYYQLKKYAIGRFTLPLDLAEKIAKISNQKLSNYKIEILDSNWGAIKGGKKGIRVTIERHKDKFKEWGRKSWEKNLKSLTNIKEIKIPEIDEKLAEFIGVYLGDGTLTKYFIRIFGDKNYDYHYFNYLSSLVKSIFNIDAKIKTEKGNNLLILHIGSKKLCDYIKDNFGFKDGDKIRNKHKIPDSIIKDRKLLFACLRGLVDTDGSVSKDGGNILCIRFRSHNPIIISQLKEINAEYNIFTFSNKTTIGTRNQAKIDEFFKNIGSSNLSNIIRYCEFKRGNILRKAETLKYASLYKDIKLPWALSPVV